MSALDVNDDQIMLKIRATAALIRHIALNAEAYPDEAWSKGQLSSMLCEVREQADELLKLSGVYDVERYFSNAAFNLTEDRGSDGNGLDAKYRPYSETE